MLRDVGKFFTPPINMGGGGGLKKEIVRCGKTTGRKPRRPWFICNGIILWATNCVGAR